MAWSCSRATSFQFDFTIDRPVAGGVARPIESEDIRRHKPPQPARTRPVMSVPKLSAGPDLAGGKVVVQVSKLVIASRLDGNADCVAWWRYQYVIPSALRLHQ